MFLARLVYLHELYKVLLSTTADGERGMKLAWVGLSPHRACNQRQILLSYLSQSPCMSSDPCVAIRKMGCQLYKLNNWKQVWLTGWKVASTRHLHISNHCQSFGWGCKGEFRVCIICVYLLGGKEESKPWETCLKCWLPSCKTLLDTNKCIITIYTYSFISFLYRLSPFSTSTSVYLRKISSSPPAL